jgi:hypothetical protein
MSVKLNSHAVFGRGMLIVAALLMAVLTVTTAGPKTSHASVSAVIRPTATQVSYLNKLVSTPLGRAKVESAFEQSFGKLGEVGFGIMPKPGSIQTAASQWSWGVTGYHVWFILSYADVINGAVVGAEAVCIARLHINWLCAGAAGLLLNLANGHGWSTSHGIWAAVYWWPVPYATGGSW